MVHRRAAWHHTGVASRPPFLTPVAEPVNRASSLISPCTIAWCHACSHEGRQQQCLREQECQARSLPSSNLMLEMKSRGCSFVGDGQGGAELALVRRRLHASSSETLSTAAASQIAESSLSVTEPGALAYSHGETVVQVCGCLPVCICNPFPGGCSWMDGLLISLLATRGQVCVRGL